MVIDSEVLFKQKYARKRAELVITHLYDVDCNGDPTRNSILMKRPENLTYAECDADRPVIYVALDVTDLKGSCVPYTPDCINPDLLLEAQEAGEHHILAQMLFFHPVKFHKVLEKDKKRKKRFFRVQKLMAKFNDYLEANRHLTNEENAAKMERQSGERGLLKCKEEEKEEKPVTVTDPAAVRQLMGNCGEFVDNMDQ